MLHMKQRISTLLNENQEFIDSLKSAFNLITAKDDQLSKLNKDIKASDLEKLRHIEEHRVVHQILEENMKLTDQMQTTVEEVLHEKEHLNEMIEKLQRRSEQLTKEKAEIIEQRVVQAKLITEATTEAIHSVDSPVTLEELQERKIHQLLATISVLEKVIQETQLKVNHFSDEKFQLEKEIQKQTLQTQKLIEDKAALATKIEAEVNRNLALLREVASTRLHLEQQLNGKVDKLELRNTLKELDNIAAHDELYNQRLRVGEASNQLVNSRLERLKVLHQREEKQLTNSSERFDNSDKSNPPPQNSTRIIVKSSGLQAIFPLIGWLYNTTVPQHKELIV